MDRLTTASRCSRIWAYSSRTLTSSAAATVAATVGATLNITPSRHLHGDDLRAHHPGDVKKLWLTVKAKDSDADTAAKIQFLVSNPGVGTDGLIVLNGAASTVGYAGLVVAQAAGRRHHHRRRCNGGALVRAADLVYDVEDLYVPGPPTVTTQLHLGHGQRDTGGDPTPDHIGGNGSSEREFGRAVFCKARSRPGGVLGLRPHRLGRLGGDTLAGHGVHSSRRGPFLCPS